MQGDARRPQGWWCKFARRQRCPGLSYPDHSRSAAAVMGDRSESRQRACPLTRREPRERESTSAPSAFKRHSLEGGEEIGNIFRIAFVEKNYHAVLHCTPH